MKKNNMLKRLIIIPILLSLSLLPIGCDRNQEILNNPEEKPNAKKIDKIHNVLVLDYCDFVSEPLVCDTIGRAHYSWVRPHEAIKYDNNIKIVVYSGDKSKISKVYKSCKIKGNSIEYRFVKVERILLKMQQLKLFLLQEEPLSYSSYRTISNIESKINRFYMQSNKFKLK